MKKLLFAIVISICFLSGCFSGSTGVPDEALPGEAPAGEAPPVEAPGVGTTPPSAVIEGWSGWTQVPGGATTDATLAAADFDDKLYVFANSVEDKNNSF